MDELKQNHDKNYDEQEFDEGEGDIEILENQNQLELAEGESQHQEQSENESLDQNARIPINDILKDKAKHIK